MVIPESFVTRKPLEFTLIVLFVVLIFLMPVYYFTKHSVEDAPTEFFIAETYDEVSYQFSPESDLTMSEKKMLFKTSYEGHFVQWSGTLLSCTEMTPWFRVSVDQSGDGFGDVLFTTPNNCTTIPAGQVITYKVRLIDLKIRTFTGKDGEVIQWSD